MHSRAFTPHFAHAGISCLRPGVPDGGPGRSGPLRPGGLSLISRGSGQWNGRSEVTGVSHPFVSIRGTYTFRADGAVIVSDSTLRFRSRDEVKSSLAAHGYRALDVREAPDRPGREFVFIAERTT